MASVIDDNGIKDAFITGLIEFDLTEQEAQCYYYLLTCGPQTSPSLAKALSVDRDGVHRTLTTLIEKDMVRPSLQSPTTYVAVELSIALETAMQHRTSELEDIKARQQELREFSHQHPLHPSAEVSTLQVVRNVREIASTVLSTLLSTEAEFLWIVPKEGLHVASIFGINDIVRELCERGGCTRGITDITAPMIPLVQELLDIGEEVRHLDGYRGVYYALFDSQHCMSAINVDMKQLTPDTPASALYTNDSVYATYLLSFDFALRFNCMVD